MCVSVETEHRPRGLSAIWIVYTRDFFGDSRFTRIKENLITFFSITELFGLNSMENLLVRL